MRSQITRRVFLRGSAAILTGLSTFKYSSAQQKIIGSTDYRSTIDKIMQTFPLAMAQRDITGTSIALIDGEDTVWSGGFGFTDRFRRTRVTADTLFHVGSISKSFTALGVLKAVDKNLLTLDDPVKRHLPWFVVNSRFSTDEVGKITLRHLLSHHSGLGTWSTVGNPSDPKYHSRRFEDVVKSVRDSWLKFPPGQRFEYSNQGIDLAGYLLETVSAEPFADLMREEILIPLGMTNSTFDQAEATRKESCAVGYQGKSAVPVVNGIVMPLIAAGGLFASASDLARFVFFHVQGGKSKRKQILPQKLLEEMYTPQLTARDQISGYGLGIYKAIEHGTARLSHGGLGYGISAHYRFLPEHRIGVVVLSNQDAAHNAPDLTNGILESMLTTKLGGGLPNKPLESEENSVIYVDKSTLRRFEGTYMLYEGILFRFKYENGDLFHIVGKDRIKLHIRSATEFQSGSRLYKFLLAENGKVQGVRIVDPYYDPQTAENSILHLPLNDSPADSHGPNKDGWRRLTGRYNGSFIGLPSEARISVEKGNLYLNGELKLIELKPDFFIAADGEEVIFRGEQLSVGNKTYPKKQ